MNTPPLMDPEVPGIRLVHSASSLATLMADPAWYELIYVHGHRFDQSKEAPLSFGGAYHAALEAGDEALRATGFWVDALECSECAARAAFSGHLYGDRYRTPEALIRAAMGYWENWKVSLHEPLALEVPWTVELPLKAPCGLPYIVCGRFDAIARVYGQVMILERKHTTKALDFNYWANYRNSVQTRTYALGAYSKGNVSICLDACQLHLADPKRGERREPQYARNIFEFTPADIQCHLHDLVAWLRAAEGWARDGHWPRRNNPWGPDARWRELLDEPLEDRFVLAPPAQPLRHPLETIMGEV